MKKILDEIRKIENQFLIVREKLGSGMVKFARHLDCRAANCGYVAKSYKDLRKHMEKHRL